MINGGVSATYSGRIGSEFEKSNANVIGIGTEGQATPSLLIARQIGSNDAASAASAASYRYEARMRELHARFENELQAVRDAYLRELAGLDLADE